MATANIPDTTSSTRKKLALIIGIDNYEHLPKLKNAQNDAKALSKKLESIGFIACEPHLDTTKEEMKHLFATFEALIKSDDLVLFYFAGHGFQWEDQNYFMPKDFPIINETDPKKKGQYLKKHGINAQHILDSLTDQLPYVTIFFLDCCRTYALRNRDAGARSDPLIDSNLGDLAPMQKAGTLIAFGCAAGAIVFDKPDEPNGLFMKHLVKHITTPNEDIASILRDVTNGVMADSNDEQMPFLSVQLRHKNIYLCEQAESQPMTKETVVDMNTSRRKLALVIGISNYQDLPLESPRNDITDMSSALQRIGFRVTTHLNSEYMQWHDIINNFIHSIEPGDIILFYFSGCGNRWEDEDFLILAGTVNMEFRELKRRAIPTQETLWEILHKNPYTTIFLLDCSRSRPSGRADTRGLFAASHKSLAREPDAGSLIAFACQPGLIAMNTRDDRNGLFTKHLLRHIETPNEDIHRLLRKVVKGVIEESGSKQIPHISASLTDDVCLFKEP